MIDPIFDTKIFANHFSQSDIRVHNQFIQAAAPGDPVLIVQFNDVGTESIQRCHNLPSSSLQLPRLRFNYSWFIDLRYDNWGK